MSSYKVYCWINKINGKRYVGMTCQTMNKRAGSHMHGYCQTPHFWNAIQKYGEDAFECKILASGLTLEEADQKERNYIRRYRTRNPAYGYNIDKGGINHQTEATLAKQRRKTAAALKVSQKAIAYRRTLSQRMKYLIKDPAYRAAMSEGLRRMWADPEIKARRIAAIKRTWSDPVMKAKIIAARRATGKQCGPYKPVHLYCKETDTTYETIGDAEKALNIKFQSLMSRYARLGINTFMVGTRKGTPYTLTRHVIS